MDKKQNEKENALQANRILYLVIIGVLALSAIIIGITAALRRPSSSTSLPIPNDGESMSEDATEGGTEEVPSVTTPPSLLAPVSGNVYKKHDLSVLVQSTTMGDWRVHSGIDIAAALGDEVKAAADGKVDKVWEDPLMGTCISITHTGGLTSVYQNLHETVATGILPGVSVKQGDVIGAIGETALIECADDAHLHFEVLLDGEAVDPLDHISADSQSASLTFDEDNMYEG